MKHTIFLLPLLLITASCSNQSSKALYQIVEDGKVGYIDSLGNIVISPQYDIATDFFHGYAIVVSDTITKRCTIQFNDIQETVDSLFINYYYITPANDKAFNKTFSCTTRYDTIHPINNKSISDFLFDSFCFTKDGLAAFVGTNDRYGYIDTRGNIAIAPQYGYARPFSEGKAVVVYAPADIRSLDINKLGLSGCIDTNGDLIIDYKYDRIDDYLNDRTFGSIHSAVEHNSTGISGTIVGKDEEGNMIIDRATATVGDNSVQRMIAFNTLLLDENGNAIGAPLQQTYQYFNFSDEGLACAVPDGIGRLLGRGAMFMDKNGHFITPAEGLSNDEIQKIFEDSTAIEVFPEDLSMIDIGHFSDGFAPVKFDDDNYVFVDTHLITHGSEGCYIFEYAYPFSSGLAAVKIDGKYGYINKQFKLVIPCIYDEAGYFSGELAHVSINKDGMIISSYINKNGDVVWQNIEYEKY